MTVAVEDLPVEVLDFDGFGAVLASFIREDVVELPVAGTGAVFIESNQGDVEETTEIILKDGDFKSSGITMKEFQHVLNLQAPHMSDAVRIFQDVRVAAQELRVDPGKGVLRKGGAQTEALVTA